MKIITSSLSGAALAWVVAKCENLGYADLIGAVLDKTVAYHRRWEEAGPIIERERITIEPWGLEWVASLPAIRKQAKTPLEAAMRCFVASKLGDEVEVPEELV